MPIRLTSATDDYDQEQAAQAVGEANQQAASMDYIGQEQASSHAFHQQLAANAANAERAARKAESNQRKQEAAQRDAVARAKKVGIKTEVTPTGDEDIVRHEDNAPVWEHGFQSEPEPMENGDHAVKYRTPRGQVYTVPTKAIRSRVDPAGNAQYEFDIAGPDGKKQTIQQPVGSKPLWSVDPKTGMRYTGAPDPETGSVGTTPIGIDPVAASEAAIQRQKEASATAMQERKFQADSLRLDQSAKETNLQPLKKTLTDAERELKDLENDKVQYRQSDADGLQMVTKVGDLESVTPIETSDAAKVSKAQAWIARKATVAKTLADTKAAHDPLAAEVFGMEQKRDQLAKDALNAGHEAELKLQAMQAAHKAGIGVHTPDWQRRYNKMRADPAFTGIFTQAQLDDAGGPLADDVREAALPETTKILRNVLGAQYSRNPTQMAPGAGVRDPNSPMQRPPEPPSLLDHLEGGLAAENVAKPGQDARALAFDTLGITDPEKWKIAPVDGPRGELGYHSLIRDGQAIGELSARDNRIVLPKPETEQADNLQQSLINTNAKGLPVYFASDKPPLPRTAVRNLITQGEEVGNTVADPFEREKKLAEIGLSPPAIRQKVMDGQLSVQDGRLLNAAFHGGADVVTTPATIRQGFQKWLDDKDTGAVNGAQFRNGDNEAKKEVVNRYFDSLNDNANNNIIRPNRATLATAREEMLKAYKGPDFLGSGLSAGGLAKQTVVGMVPLVARGVYSLTGVANVAGWMGLGTEADRLAHKQGWQDVERLANFKFVHRMAVRDDIKESMDGLKAWANQASPGDQVPPEIAAKIKDAYANGFHQLSPDKIAASADTWDINKDPALKGMVQRFLNTADPSTWDGLHSLMAMNGDERQTQKEVMAYNDRPKVTAPEDVIKRGKLLNLELDKGRAAELMTLGKALEGAKDQKTALNILARAGGMLKLSPQNAQLALGLLTRTESEDPNSIASIMRSSWSSSTLDAAVEVGSDAAQLGLGAFFAPETAGGSVAAAGASIASKWGAKAALRGAYSKTIGAALRAGTERSTSFATLATRLNAARAAVGTVAGKAGEAIARAGVATPKFGAPLTLAQKAQNLGVTALKTGVVGMIPEGAEEIVSHLASADPSAQGALDSAAGGAFGSLILSPIFAGYGTARQGLQAARNAKDYEAHKVAWAKDANQRMAGTPNFQPYTSADYETVKATANNPAQQTAVMDHAAAVHELNAATEEHAQNVMEMQDAAGNAVPNIEPSGRLLAAQAAVEHTTANLEGITAMTYSATDELRAIPEAERPLYTGVAKAVSGAADYTAAEAKALTALGGESAIAFRQSESLPADVAGPANVTTLPNAPAVTPSGTGGYRLPPGVRVHVPQNAINALHQRAPSLSGMLGGQQMAAASNTSAPATVNPTPTATDPYQPISPDLHTRMNTPDAQVSDMEKAEVNKKWDAASPYNVPAAFVHQSQGGKASGIPTGEKYDSTAPIDESQVLAVTHAAVADEVAARNEAAGRKLVQVSNYQAHDGGAYYNIGADVAFVNVQRLARSIWHSLTADPKRPKPTRAEVAAEVRLTIDEEVTHAAQIQAARGIYDQAFPDAKIANISDAEKQAAFMGWVADHYGAIWRDDLTPEVKAATIKAYGAILESRPEWVRAFEALRMIVQQRKHGIFTEASSRLRQHFEAVLKVLKGWYQGVMDNGKNPRIKAEIEAIEALLNAPVKNNSPGSESAQTTSTGAVSTTGTSSESPVKGSSETVATTDGNTSLTNENASSRNFNVAISNKEQRQAVFPNAESLAAFKFKLDLNIAGDAKSKPDEVAAAQQRANALIAAIQSETGISDGDIEKSLIEYHDAIVQQSKGVTARHVVTPPVFTPLSRFNPSAEKSKALPAPEGGDIISELSREGVRRLGPPTTSPEWDWYNELVKDAGRSKLPNLEARKAARDGDLADAKAKLFWLQDNVVSTTGGRSIDEAAQDIAGSGEELGRAILAAIDARVATKGRYSDPALAAEVDSKAQSQNFATLVNAGTATGRQMTGADIVAALDPDATSNEVKIGDEWFDVNSHDESGVHVTASGKNAHLYGDQTLAPDQSYPVTEVDGAKIEPRQAPSEDDVFSAPVVSADQDAEYLQSVQSGDVAKQQAMVDAAAKAAGYTVEGWHGSNASFETFEKSKDPLGFHFGTPDAANQAKASTKKAGDWKIRKFYLDIKNPLRLPDLDGWSTIDLRPELIKAGVIDRSLPMWQVESEGKGDIRKGLVARIRLAGFDGVIYKNEFEGNGDSHIAFVPNQIKSADPITRDEWEGSKSAGAKASNLLRNNSNSVVEKGVVSRIHDSKILDPIIQSIPVDVMDVLGSKERATNALLHNPSVLQDALVSNSNLLVGLPAWGRLRDETMGVVAGLRAELGRTAASEPTSLNREMFSALDALQNNLVTLLGNLSSNGIGSLDDVSQTDLSKGSSLLGGKVTNSTAESSPALQGQARSYEKIDTADFTRAFGFHDSLNRSNTGTIQAKRIIPLSQRFNPQSNSILYSSPARGYRTPASMLANTAATMQGMQKPAAKKSQESAENSVKTPKSSTQLTLSPKDAAPIIAFGESIPKDELYDSVDPEWSDGALETEPHVTVLYGLTKHEADPVAQAIAGHGPITVTLGKMSLFKSDDYDVLKIDVESPELRALNAKLSKLPNENSFPDYKPHMTIAYLKKGEGEKYVGDSRFEGKRITFNTMTFSPPSELRGELGKPELPLVQPITARSILDAYRASLVGKSSVMVPIKDVFTAAHTADPSLTPESFLASIKAMDDGRALFGLADNQPQYNAAKPFVHGAAGIEMGFQPDMVQASTILHNLDMVKEKRALLPPEHAAYDKALAMIDPTNGSPVNTSEALNSAPAQRTADKMNEWANRVYPMRRALAQDIRDMPLPHSDVPEVREWLQYSRERLADRASNGYLQDEEFKGENVARLYPIYRADYNKNVVDYHVAALALSKELEKITAGRLEPHGRTNHLPNTSGESPATEAGLDVKASQDALQSAPADPAQVRAILDTMPKPWAEILEAHQAGQSIDDIAKARNIPPALALATLNLAQGRFNHLSKDFNPKPRVRAVDGGVKAVGGMPNLSLSGIPAVAAVDQQRERPEEVTHAEMQELATRMFAVDPAAAEKMVVRWMDSGTTDLRTDDMPEGIKRLVDDALTRKAAEMLMTAAAKRLVTTQAFSGAPSAHVARLIDLYRNTGTEQARALNMRRDPFDTPEERAAMYLMEVVLTPPQSMRNQIAKNPGNKGKILAEWAKKADKIKDQMRADGIDLDATFAQMKKERELAAATIPEPVKAPLAQAAKKTRQLVSAILEGKTWNEAFSASGLNFAKAKTAIDGFRASINKMAGKAATFMGLQSSPGEVDYAAQLGIPELTEQTNLNAAPVRNAKTQALAIQRNRKMVQGELDLKNPLSVNKARKAAEGRKASGFDKMSEFWRASILSGPQTGIVNVVSGLTYGTYEATFKKMATATLADIARMFGMKPDAASWKDLPAMVAAVFPSVQQAGRDMIQAWNTESGVFDSYALQLTDENGDLWKDGHTSALTGWTKKIMHAISFRHMGAADEFVKSFFTRIEVCAQARQIARNEKLEGKAMADRIAELMEPGSLAWERALANSKRITFQDQEVFGHGKLESPLQSGHGAIDVMDKVAEIIQRTKNGNHGRALKVLTHFTFPFVSTPNNVLKAAVTMSPVGGVLAIIDGVRSLQRMKQGNVEEAKRIYNAARALDDFTNQIVAWGFILGLSSLIKPGDDDDRQPWMTGSTGLGAASTGERELAYRTAPPMSIRIGDAWYSYKKLDPFATALASIIDSIRQFHSGAPIDESSAKVLVGVMKIMKDKTMMQGVSDLVNAISDPERFATKWASSIAIGFIPNAIRAPLRAGDDFIRDTDQPNDMPFVTAMARRLGYGMMPTESNHLTPMPAVSVFGQPVRKDTGTGQPGTDMLLRLLSPVERHDNTKPDPLEVKLMAYNMSHDESFGIVAPSREITRTLGGKKVKVSLDDAEDFDFTTRSGKAFRAALEPFAQKKGPLTDDDVKEIKKIHEAVLKPFRDDAFMKALARRQADGRVKL